MIPMLQDRIVANFEDYRDVDTSLVSTLESFQDGIFGPSDEPGTVTNEFKTNVDAYIGLKIRGIVDI